MDDEFGGEVIRSLLHWMKYRMGGQIPEVQDGGTDSSTPPYAPPLQSPVHPTSACGVLLPVPWMCGVTIIQLSTNILQVSSVRPGGGSLCSQWGRGLTGGGRNTLRTA